MHRREFVILAALLPYLTACATPVNTGPGMTVTFRNVVKGKTVDVIDAVSSGGVRFPKPGSLTPSISAFHGGATEGAAPDGREVPEWVEFTWQERSYPSLRQENFSSPEEFNKAIEEKLRNSPVKTRRVLVRDRVPSDVIDEVTESNRKREPNKLAEKSLWVYFIWHESGIKFYWELRNGCCTALRAGGDTISK